MDQFDVVRAHYRAFNAADLDRIASLYDEGAIVDNVLLGDPGVHRGRGAIRSRLEAFFAAHGGALDDGGSFDVRTIGGIGTGWGWVQAEWVEHVRRRDSEETTRVRGYSHFLVEDGVIRRHRTVVTHPNYDPSKPEPKSRETRTYPERPVVGIGAIVLVAASDAERIGWSAPVPDPRGVVLIKRRFEPLAGQWSLPGGMLEVGETLEAGVKREIEEETGLAISVGPLVDVFDRILFDADARVRFHFVLIDYLCRPLGGRLQFASDVADVTIADPAALTEYGLAPKAEVVIRKALTLV